MAIEIRVEARDTSGGTATVTPDGWIPVTLPTQTFSLATVTSSEDATQWTISALARAVPAWTLALDDVRIINAWGYSIPGEDTDTQQAVVDSCAQTVAEYLGDAEPQTPTAIKQAALLLLLAWINFSRGAERRRAADPIRLSGASGLLARWRRLTVLTTGEDDDAQA